jgi:hypothetical protein
MIGLCFILKYGTILNFIRTPLKKIIFFKELFNCSLCIGFHVGFWTHLPDITSVIAGLNSQNGFFDQTLSILSLLAPSVQYGFYSSAICWLADFFVDVMDSTITKNNQMVVKNKRRFKN